MISNIICCGVGFNPGSVKFIPTRGFLAGVAPVIVAQIAPLKDIYAPTFSFTGELVAQPLKGDYAPTGTATGEFAGSSVTGSITVVAIRGKFGG